MSRTKTYIAADWTGDRNAVDTLHEWNNKKYLSLSFTDAHDLTQARDNSLNCSIKSSLKKRMDVSKLFVLIVGNETKTLRNGGCQYCNSYNSWSKYCVRGHSVSYQSYIDYECEMAVKAGIRIVVLYNALTVNKAKCPDIVKNQGYHIPMHCYNNGKIVWDYQNIKEAINY